MKRREEKIGFEIRRLDHMLGRNMQAHVRAAGIDEVTLMHGWIIRYLYTNQDKDVFQKDIEQYFSIGRSTVTNIIQLMERKGYIARESVEHDARLKKVVLTEKGIRRCLKIWSRVLIPGWWTGSQTRSYTCSTQ